VQDSEDIAQNDDGHEEGAFPKNHFCSKGFYDGKGPAARETEQHQYLKNADIHCFILIFQCKIKQREDTHYSVSIGHGIATEPFSGLLRARSNQTNRHDQQMHHSVWPPSPNGNNTLCRNPLHNIKARS
jgi:hypothetical protein